MEGHQLGVSSERRRGLAPVSKRWPWITGGLSLQVIGVAMPVVYVLEKAHKEDFGGHITRATIRLAWHQAVHSKAGLALMIAGVLVFATGSVLLARPFAKSWLTLLVAVPIAAVAGLLVLGAAVLIVAVIVAAAGSLFDGGGGGGGGGGSSTAADVATDLLPFDSTSSAKRRRKQSPQDPPVPS
jgi:hypothetical protein